MFNEASCENAVITLFRSLGHEHTYGPDIERDYRNPLYIDVPREQLAVINPKAKNGLEVPYQEKGETKTDIINLIDFKNPSNNTFQVIS